MTTALCLQCGGRRGGAFVPCSSCGANTSGVRDYDLLFTDHHFTLDELDGLAGFLIAAFPRTTDRRLRENALRLYAARLRPDLLDETALLKSEWQEAAHLVAQIGTVERALDEGRPNAERLRYVCVWTFHVLEAFRQIRCEVLPQSVGRALRMIIPIPLIFHAVDYTGCARGLGVLSREVDKITGLLSDSSSLLPAAPNLEQVVAELGVFVGGLRSAIGILVIMCNRQAAKVKREGSYSWKEYNADVDELGRAEERVRNVGHSLDIVTSTLGWKA